MLALFRKPSEDVSYRSKMDLSLPIEKASYVIVDTELTGLSLKTDSIVSIGALKMTGSRIELNRTFYEVVRPGTELTSESIVIHEITPSETEKRPGIEGIMESFLTFCEGSVIVGHFVSLDLKFLAKEMKRTGFGSLKNPAADTSRIQDWIADQGNGFSSNYMGRMENKDLLTLARRYQIPVQGSHNALMDAYITAQIFQRFITILNRLGVRTLRDLLRIGKP
jgi:DNA polymerase-3 subunit epsilon